jgi:hypothetical protein
METALPTESRSTQVETTEESQPQSEGQTTGWSSADLEILADKVYELLLKDLMLERERGLW